MDWNQCIEETNAVKISPNRNRAEFLLRRAEETIEVLKNIVITDKNIRVFFVNYYDALLETLHAMMYANGYKVKNHYCLGYYVRDNLKERELFAIIDRARSVRNSIIYYGESFDKEILLKLINDIKDSINRLKKLIDQSL